ncbi:hypothetical protein IPM65_02220 [Candidatus Roizmanbacteria bacterium]|nr:MAG: hypothetical protein IPM65_02220 [Candidatus Roizmanbacteria bacterium]
MILTNHEQVSNFVNNNPNAEFDIIILDRDCKLEGSFHILDIERFGSEKVIAISTVEEYNEAAKERGVTRVVQKDLSDLDRFSEKVVTHVNQMISGIRSIL